MARARTLAQLRASVRQRADIEGVTTYTDPEIDGYINDSIADLHRKLVRAWEDDYTDETTFATVVGQEAYDLSGVGPLHVRAVELLVGASAKPRPLDRWNFTNRSEYDRGTNGGRPAAYRLVGLEAIRILPVPDAVHTIRVWYVPGPTTLVLDTDEYDGRSGFEEYVVADAAIKVGIKEEADVRALVAERAQALADIMATAKVKDANRPDTVLDVESAQARASHHSRYPEWDLP